jgi:hypothetical protein
MGMRRISVSALAALALATGLAAGTASAAPAAANPAAHSVSSARPCWGHHHHYGYRWHDRWDRCRDRHHHDRYHFDRDDRYDRY